MFEVDSSELQFYPSGLSTVLVDCMDDQNITPVVKKVVFVYRGEVQWYYRLSHDVVTCDVNCDLHHLFILLFSSSIILHQFSMRFWIGDTLFVCFYFQISMNVISIMAAAVIPVLIMLEATTVSAQPGTSCLTIPRPVKVRNNPSSPVHTGNIWRWPDTTNIFWWTDSFPFGHLVQGRSWGGGARDPPPPPFVSLF